MTYHTLYNSTTTDASDVNDNFQHIGAGSRLPMSSVGVSFATTDSAYDFGADATRFNDIYCDNVDFAGSVTTADKTLWTLEAETTLTESTTSIQFSGLNGDDAVNYMLIGNAIVASGEAIYLHYGFNGDSTLSYGRQDIEGTGSTVTAARNTGQGSMRFITVQGSTNTSDGVGFFRTILHAKTGSERKVMSVSINGGVTSVSRIYEIAGVWGDTSSTLTSIEITYGGGTTLYMSTNTTIQLWKRA